MALEDAQPSHNGTFNEANVGAMQSYLPFPIFHPQSAHMGQTPAYSHVPQMVPVQASQVSQRLSLLIVADEHHLKIHSNESMKSPYN